MADKDFKVKQGLSLGTPLPVSMGGTGQTSANNTLNALLPSQVGNSSKVLSTDGTNTSWVAQAVAYQRGGTASRPVSPTAGDLYYNTDTNVFEQYTSLGWFAIAVAPGSPTGVTATNQGTGRAYNNGQASIAFTPNTSAGAPSSFTVTPTPSTSPSTFTGTSSPITVTGLASSTQYTYTVSATSAYGTSSASSASSGVTATTVPQAPTIGTATAGDTSASLTFTAGATGGVSITNYKYSTDGTSYTAFSPAQTSSPLSFSGLTNGQSYAYYLKAVNSNGDSAASSISNSVTPAPASSYYSLSSTTLASGASSVTLSNIDQNYTHLVIRCCVYPTVSGSTESNYALRFNGDTGTNYFNNLSVGDGSSQAALYNWNDTSMGWGYTYGTWAWAYPAPVVAQFIIPNYSSSTNYKSMIEYEGVTGTSVGGAQTLGGVWKSTSAITSVTMLTTNGLNMNTNSYLAVYGIKGS